MFDFFANMLYKLIGYPCKTFGVIVLGYGRQEVFVNTKCKPRGVFLKINNVHHHHMPVCGGGVNMAGANITKHGFVLYADIKTNVCSVEWLCEF